MKITRFASILALFLLSFATSQVATAQSAHGTYQFSLADGYTKYVEFEATAQSNGSAVGGVFLSDEAPVLTQDVDGTGEQEERYAGFYIRAEFDGMVVNRNQAVMSGTVTESSINSLIGQRVLLMVEDNGDNTGEPDKLTWGIYQPIERDWTPSDAEWEKDPGVGLTWRATDAEQRDDEGYLMPRSEEINAQSFPVSAYSFLDVERPVGDIRVDS
ncbi:MAG TPA: hypothetical protein VF791_04945 [Pyrinomonadaceae bacterium]